MIYYRLAAVFGNNIRALYCLYTAAHVPLFSCLYISYLKTLACHQVFK